MNWQQEALLMPRAITKLPIPTAAVAKNYPAIVPTPLSSSLRSKTHELQQEALLMPRAITKLPIPTVHCKKLSRYSPHPFIIKLEIKNS